MPQRALSKNKPWIYVAADDMSEYDILAAQQLTGMDPRTSLNNDLAFGDNAKPISTSTVVSPLKRKRPDHASTEGSPSKRVNPKEMKPAAKKLGIPRKAQLIRHMGDTRPAVRGDIYEFPSANTEQPHSSQAANARMQRSKKAAPSSEAAEGPTVDQSSPVSKAPRATAYAEGQGSASVKGSVGLTTKPERKRGRPKKRTKVVNLTKKPGRKGGKPSKQTATVRQGSTPPAVARSNRVKHREAVHDAGRAASKVRDERSASPKKRPQPTVDVDDDGDASDADEAELRQETVIDDDDDGEDDGSEAVVANVAENPGSSQGEVEGDVEGYVEAVQEEEGGEEEEEEAESAQEGSLQVDNGDGVVEEHMDLLGQHREWEKVLKAAASVHRTVLRTQVIKELHAEIKEARSLYKKLEASGDMDHAALKGLNEQLQESLDSIENQINDLSEHNALTKRSETINDMYGRAIPAIVILLKRALSLRTSQARGLNDFCALGEIVRIQDMVVRLCEKAKGWKVRPNTTYPIVKPTTAVIFPYIRDMRNKFFIPKLNILRVREKVRQNRLKTIREEEARLEQSQREAEVPTQQRCQRDPRILANIIEETQRRRNERNAGRRVVPVVHAMIDDGREVGRVIVEPAPRNGHADPHKFTEREIQELVIELCRSKHLPAEQRYLAALTNPVLQNMLPEHIRAESLSLKPDLMEEFGSSPWIKSIE